jgi:hypothetical protein
MVLGASQVWPFFKLHTYVQHMLLGGTYNAVNNHYYKTWIQFIGPRSVDK